MRKDESTKHILIHPDIVNTTIWNAKSGGFTTWMTMVMLADEDGIINKTDEQIMKETRLSQKEFKKELGFLSSPDPLSEIQDGDGARIVRTNTGWLVKQNPYVIMGQYDD